MFKKVYGPYLNKTSKSGKDRRYVVVVYSDGTKRSMSFARHLVEKQLGRRLNSSEEVDHVNNDKTDDLQILTKAQNIAKSRRPTATVAASCPECSRVFEAKLRLVRHNQGSYKKAGPFCGRSCAGRYGQRKQRSTHV